MGAYLSTPITEKFSEDHRNERLKCGASSMQGWRVSQEDAHNCCLDLTETTALFGVYDGHGGREVAIYTQSQFPEELKSNEKFIAGEYSDSLKESFLSFDKKLVNSEVVVELKKIMNQGDKETGDEAEEDDEDDNIGDLREEAAMPLEQLMAKYQMKRLCGEGDAPASPFLRAKGSQGCSGEGSSASTSGASSSSEAAGQSTSSTTDNACDSAGGSSSTSSPKVASVVEGEAATGGDGVTSSSSCSSSAAGSSGTSRVSSSCKTRTTLADKYHNGQLSASKQEADTTLDSSSDVKVNGDVLNCSEETEEKEAEVTSSSENGPVDEKPISPIKKKITAADLFKKFINVNTGAGADEDEEEEEDDESSESEAYVGEESGGDDDEDEALEDEDDEDEDSDDEQEDEEEEDDEFTMNMTDEPGMDSGCTAVVALVLQDKVVVANAGDSRCVASRAGVAVELSADHKPEDPEELARITKAGGKVTSDGRVNGGLNLSRALGDHIYKKNTELSLEEQMISPLPDIQELPITPDLEFLVLACDGIWNYMSSQDVIDFVRPKLQKNPEKLSSVCEELFDYCLAPHTMGDGTGCDNMTAVIVQLRPDEPLPDIVKPKPSVDVALPTADKIEEEIAAVIKELGAEPSKRRAEDEVTESFVKRSKTEDFQQETP